MISKAEVPVVDDGEIVLYKKEVLPSTVFT
jgi:hypothetical protein